MLNLLARQLEGNVSVPGIIMGSSVGMHPLWILFAVSIIATAFRYPNGMLLFERWQKVPIVEVVSEGSPKVAASGGELAAGLRSSIGREG